MFFMMIQSTKLEETKKEIKIMIRKTSIERIIKFDLKFPSSHHNKLKEIKQKQQRLKVCFQITE